ncbi:axin isoform X2 [Phymastichus coffea]|uniref:axin isoform X2 n=1 Tax=Phymastichus coffea TaxID=108790 RepID=UPI00273C1EDB|nr:axin isoform X2 [Phymastichus coffea]
MSGPQPPSERLFNENSPRPPVPGEEGEVKISSSRSKDPQARRSSCDASCAPLGYEPEGRSDRVVVMERSAAESSSSSCGNNSSCAQQLACLQWSRSLHALLEDPKGLELFEHYLHQEGHIYALSFWFACEGLKEERDPNKLTAIIKVLIRRFFHQRQQLAVPDDVRKELTRRYRDGQSDKRMFDLAQKEVERLLKETAHPNFLRSDVYLQYVRWCQSAEEAVNAANSALDDAEHEDDKECPSSPDEPSVSCSANPLPTVHEDSELTPQHHHPSHHHHQSQHSYHQHHHNPQQPVLHHHHGSQSSVSTTDYNKQGEPSMRLTKDMLMATQQFRAFEVRPKPEAYAGDSASIARRSTRKQFLRHSQQMKKSAMVNRETDIHETIIPRTQRVTREQTQPKNPVEFAKLLIEKLERVKRDRDNEETLDRKLKEVDAASSTGFSDITCDTLSTVVPQTVAPARSLADALREKLQVEEDSDQAILDQHVSRVWSDLTPSRSPKLASPRPRSPDKCRRQSQISPQPQVYPSRPPSYRSQRKEKDVFSTFSGDSGNVHDFQEPSEIYNAGSMSSLGSHLPKSKSVPSDYADSLHTQDLYLQGQDQRYRRLDAQRSSATKKSMTELTDSGVSVISDATSAAYKDRLISLYKKEGSCVSGVKAETMNVNKLNRNKKFANSPQQPFIGDPGMPLLPQPHTATQLEEAKRRLEYEQYEQNRGKQQRYPGESMPTSVQTSTASNQSTLRREGKQEVPSDFTTVVFSFCDEKVPYRTKISGYNVTLKQFKDVLPKKGSYRYFFKTECEDLDMQVIQEEITDDSEVLPLWEGKIMAQVKALE